ncbi:MAG: glycoside hydrolase family 55 protein [Kiritimatiellia bacterium]
MNTRHLKFAFFTVTLLFLAGSPILRAEILAEDLVEYPVGTELRPYAGNHANPIPIRALSGGVGWKGPWTQWYGFRENDARIGLEEGALTGAIPTGYAPKGDTRIRIYHASLGRELAKAAGGEGTLYIGFATRHNSAANGSDKPVGVGFQLLTGGIQGKPVFSFFREARDEWGVDDVGDTSVNNTGWKEDTKPYFYLFKIVDNGTVARVFVKRFTEADTLTEEPTTWQVDGVEIPSFTFDTLYFKGNKAGFNAGSSPIWIDEVRLATSFSDFPISQENVEKKKREEEAREAARIALEAKIKERMVTAWEPGPVPMPESSRIANVVAYGAARDGVTDDTEAINRAFAANTTVYFPPGTYLVSGTLRVGTTKSQHRLVGAGRDATLIKLKEGTFTDKTSPRPVIGFHKDYPNVKGTTGMAFSNYLTDVTIEIGPNNPGATGVAYITNNDGAIRNVTIRSTDPDYAGFCGIELRKGWCGPGILKNVEIVGFDTAVSYSYREYSMTIENMKISKQRVAGIVNHENILSIRNLSSDNRVPVIKNGTPRAVTVVLDSTFTGSSKDSAILNEGGYVFARKVSAPGYASVIHGVSGTTLAEYSSIGAANTLDLPIQDHPIDPLPLEQWVSVVEHGATFDDKVDDGPAIQAAIDAAAAAGKKKVYFPRGGSTSHTAAHYKLQTPVRVHGSVEEIDFLFSPVQVSGEGGFVVEDGPAPVVVFQRVGMVWGGKGTLVHHKSNRAVHIRDLNHGHTHPYKNLGSTGDVYLENIAPVDTETTGPFVTGQNVWGRSVNPEFSGVHFHNSGATVWILGFKTEQNGINLLTDNGGTTEVFGGFIYPVKGGFKKLPGDFPSFRSVNSRQCLVGLGSNSNAGNNLVPVEEERGGKVHSFPASDFNHLGYQGAEWLIPVYLSPTLR